MQKFNVSLCTAAPSPQTKFLFLIVFEGRGDCTQARKIAKAQTAREKAFHLGDVVRSQVRATHAFSLAPRYEELT